MMRKILRSVRKVGLPLGTMYVLLVMLVALGGASRADELAQTGIRLIAIAAMMAMVFYQPATRWASAVSPALKCLAGAAVLIALQLIPLPYGIWTALPGRSLYSQITDLAHLGEMWRPWTLTPDRTWNALFSLVVPLSMLVVLTRMDRGERRMLLPILLLIVYLSAALMLIQIGGGLRISAYVLTRQELAAGLFANRNHQALFMAMGIPMTAAWAVEPRLSAIPARLRAGIAVAGIALLTIMIPATGSRAGLVLGAAALLMALYIGWGPARRGLAALRRRQRWRIVFSGLAGLVAIIAVASGFARAVGLQRLLAMDVLADTRAKMFPRVVEGFWTFFPFGSGYGSFDPVFRRFEQLGDLRTSYFNQAHDDYLQILFEGGLFGAAALAVVLALFLFRSYQVWTAPGDRPATRFARLASMVMALIFAASFVDFPLRTPLMMATLALLSVWLNERPSERVGE